MGVLIESGTVEDEELDLRPPETGVADAGGFQVSLGLLGDVSRVAGVCLAGERVSDVADQAEGLDLVHRVQGGGGGVRDQEHVALVDGLEASDAGAVESGAVVEQALGDLAGGDRQVLHRSGHVNKLEIDNLDPFILDYLEYVVRVGRPWHGTPLLGEIGLH